MASTDVQQRGQQHPVPQLIQQIRQQRDTISRLVPDYERFIRQTVTEVRNNPELAECTAASFLGAFMISAQLDLPPGREQGLVYLIPRWNSRVGAKEVHWLIGYKGIRTLALRTGRYRSLQAHVVHETDEFELEQGSNPDVRHMIGRPWDPGEAVGYYAIARGYDDEDNVVEFLTVDEVEARRHAGDNPDGFGWTDFYDQMAKKSCIRAMQPNLPLSEAMRRVDEADQSVVDLSQIRGEATSELTVADGPQAAPQPQGQPTRDGGSGAASRPSDGSPDAQQPSGGDSGGSERRCPKCDATGGTHNDTCPTMAGDEVGGQWKPLSEVIKASDTRIADVLRYAQDRARQIEVGVPQSTSDLDDLDEVLEAELRVWLADHDDEGDADG